MTRKPPRRRASTGLEDQWGYFPKLPPHDPFYSRGFIIGERRAVPAMPKPAVAAASGTPTKDEGGNS
jgi:hypothetical protein